MRKFFVLFGTMFITTYCFADQYGAYSNTDDVYNGYLEINGQAYASVYGGKTDVTSGYANNNKLVVNNNIANSSSYNHILAAGGDAGSGHANNNTVIVNGGVLSGTSYTYLYGGHGSLGANNNTIILNGGTISNVTIVAGSSSAGSYVTNNTIAIGRNMSLDPNITLYGAYTGNYTVANRPKYEGNTIELHQAGLHLNQLYVFQNYYFVLPNTIQAGDTVLNATALTYKLEDVSVGVALAGGADPVLQIGDTVTLISNFVTDNPVTINKVSLNSNMLKIQEDLFLDYDFDVFIENGQLKATAKNVSAAEETKSVVESQSAATSIINTAGDLVSKIGIKNIVKSNNNPLGMFSSIQAGNSSYKTGSSVDVFGINTINGVAKSFTSDYGDIYAGLFLEFGNANYQTSNDFSFGNVKGDGLSSYYGLGLLGHNDWKTLDGLYTDASLRVGVVDNMWQTSDLSSESIAYNNSSMYYGAHVGVGYTNKVTNSFDYDVYARYMLNVLTGDTVKVGENQFKFDTTLSNRLKVGGEVAYTGLEAIRPYVALAYENEFSGDSKASVRGLSTPTPSLNGSTAEIDLGISNKENTAGLHYNAGVATYFGMRTGVGLNLKAMYQF